MSITINLTADQFTRLTALAEQQGATAEEVAGAAVAKLIGSPESRVATDDEFRRAVEGTFAANAELYRRLAQ